MTKVFKGPMTGNTVRRFKESVKPVARLVVDATGKADREVEKVVKDPKAVVDFDARYKPYIFGLLKKHHGFVPTGAMGHDGKPVFRRGSLEMESVYHDVLAKLMLGAIDGFDLSKENVGRGAFRRYLKLVTASVVSDAEVLPPVYKPDGTPEYTDEIAKDRHGKPKLDAKGRVIHTRKKAQFQPFDVPSAQNAIAQFGLGGTTGRTIRPEWSASDIVRLRLFFAKCAYLKLTEAKMKSGREGWILKSMLDIFENGKDEDVVREELIKRNVIKSATPFYTAKTRFLDAWKACQEKEEKNVFKKIRITEKGLRGSVGKDKPLRKGVYQWRPIVTRSEAVEIAKELAAKVRAEVGSARVRFVNGIFARIMTTLVADADRKMSEKKGER